MPPPPAPPADAARVGYQPRPTRTIDPNGHDRADPMEAMVTVQSETSLRRCAPSASSCPRGRSATPAPASRSSRRRACPRTPYEKIADAAQVHRFTGVAPTVALHIPWDKVDDYARPRPARRRPGRQPRDHQLEHLPGRRLHARQRLPPGPAGPPQGRRPPARVHRHHGCDRLARPQAVVRGRHELPRPGRHPRPPGPPGRGARHGLRAARAGPADGARVQALRARVLHDGRPGLGHRLRPLRRRWARRPRSSSTPATTRRARTSSSSWRPCSARTSSAASTSTRGSTPTTT